MLKDRAVKPASYYLLTKDLTVPPSSFAEFRYHKSLMQNILVTGGAGFIGSNLVLGLNNRGYDDILVVDNLTNGVKYRNLLDCRIADYLDKETFLDRIMEDDFDSGSIEAVFHQGACSTTTEWDGRYMMENNYEYSKVLLHYCQLHKIPFIYASSAAVYGNVKTFKEERVYESPLNVYGYSKFQFDQYLRRCIPDLQSQVNLSLRQLP